MKDTHEDTPHVKTSVIAVQSETVMNQKQPVKPLKHKVKKIRKEGGITTLKVIATALTAVTMAVLSSQLTGYVNSLVLVGLVSIGTAVFSEAYRIILSLTTMKAQEVLKVNPDGTTETISVVTQEELEEYKKQNPTTQIQVIEPEKKGILALISQAFRKNPFFRMIILFAGISLVTIAATFFISNSIEQKNITYTTVEKVEEISDEKRQEIIDQVVSKSVNSEDIAKYTEEAIKKSIDELLLKDQQIQTNLTSESNKAFTDIENLKTQIETMQNQSMSDTEEIKVLNNKITQLEAMIKTLQEQQSQNKTEATNVKP